VSASEALKPGERANEWIAPAAEGTPPIFFLNAEFLPRLPASLSYRASERVRLAVFADDEKTPRLEYSTAGNEMSAASS